MVEFGEQLRKAREEKGLTQQTLAEKLYVSRQSVSHWECGDRYPDIVTAKKISQILDVSLDDLLSGKEMMKVVEKTPVVENKTINNLTIMLYAFVVISFLLQASERVLYFYVQADTIYSHDNPKFFYQYWIECFKGIFFVLIFAYGLYHAIRDTLTPKKIGIIFIAYLSVVLALDGIPDIPYWFRSFGNTMKNVRSVDRAYNLMTLFSLIARQMWSVILPCILGIIGSIFHFLRGAERKLWRNMIAIASILRILYVAIFFVRRIMIQRFEVLNSSTVDLVYTDLTTQYLVADFVLEIAIYVLIIYQAVTLYRKRKNAIELCEA